MDAMEYLEVHGEHIPKIGLGTWQMRGESCRRGVLSALEKGYRHIDTAEYYRNEREVGEALKDSGLEREEFFLTSKVWSNHFQRDQVREACRASLDRLGLDYLDLYLIHHPTEAVPLEETLAGMQDLVDENLTRYIGVSNFPVSLLERSRSLSSAPIFTDQVKFHPYHGQEELVAYCQEHDVLLTAYSPLAQGRILGDRHLQKIGGRYGKSAAQVALRWVVQQQNMITIPKASTPEHQAANLDVFDFELTAEEMETVASLG